MQPLLLYSGEQYAGSSNESYFSKVRVRARHRVRARARARVRARVLGPAMRVASARYVSTVG